MKEKALEIIKDEDSYIPPEWLIYSKSNSAILIVKNEIDELIKQLKIAVKAGDFDDYFEREAPVIFEKLNVKRDELVSLLHYERTKEKRKDVYKVDIKAFGAATAESVEPAAPHPAPMVVIADIPRAIEKKLSVLAKVSQSYSDANLYIAGILGIILVVIQLLFNFTFENRLKNNVQETVVQNLENRLRLAENKNQNLAQNLTQLRQQSLLPTKQNKKGLFVLAPVKFKQDPVMAKIYAKEKAEALLAKQQAAKKSYRYKQKRKVSSIVKPKSKTKVNSAKYSRYSKK